MRKIHEAEVEDTEERKQIEKLVNFLSRTRWARSKDAHGGITWLEFYIWFQMHSKKTEVHPLTPNAFLTEEIAAFKKVVRKINLHCVSQEDEWQLQTCYGRANRLKGVAVKNKHAGIQGLPKISLVEAEEIAKTILEMRGTRSKKQAEEHRKGLLRLKAKPFSYRRTNLNWTNKLNRLEDWTQFPVHPILPTWCERIQVLVCPKCFEPKAVDKFQSRKIVLLQI